MKNIIVLTLLLIVSASSFSQQNNPAPTSINQDYLKKSKRQKIAAWSLLLGGIGLEAIAFAAAYETESGATLLIAGFLANLASIPFFILAHGNKKKAMSLSFKNETHSRLENRNLITNQIPSLTLKISL